ncbi:MAG: zinc metalloprotease HtpX [Alkalispirochaetaceae bacterium]
MATDAIQRQKLLRYLQAGLLLAALFAMLLLVGAQLLGPFGLVIFAGITASMIYGYIRHNAVYLPRGAQLLNPWAAPTLHQMVRELSERAEIALIPPIYYIPSPTPNAATLGVGENVRLIVTDGLLRRLDYREMQGVIAHEISHIRQKDLILFAVVEGIKQMLVTLAQAGWIMLMLFFPLALFGTGIPLSLVFGLMLSPILALLLQLAISRSREFSADIGAVELTGDPYGLALALEKLDQPTRFLSILLPVPQRRNSTNSIFRTHPPTEERVRRLKAMG